MKSKEELREEMLELMVPQDWYFDNDTVEKVQGLMKEICGGKKVKSKNTKPYRVGVIVTEPNGNVRKFIGMRTISEFYKVDVKTVIGNVNRKTPGKGVFEGFKFERVDVSYDEMKKSGVNLKEIWINYPDGKRERTTIREAVEKLSCNESRIYFALKSGNAITKGKLKGYSFDEVKNSK